MNSPSSLYPKKIDLTNCDKELIHIIGTIQPHGYIIVFDSKSLDIHYYGANTHLLFNTKKDSTFTSIIGLLNPATINKITALDYSVVLAPTEIEICEKKYILITHRVNELTVLEFELQNESLNTFEQQQKISNIIQQITNCTRQNEMCDVAAKLIKKYFNYDRVMVYQFDIDWNGEVVSEEKNENLESWLGLRYPASDIPQQARKLFLRQGVRQIVNVNAIPVPIKANQEFTHSQALDLSNSELRAVSPIHIQYLKNMGVSATLTAAIVFQNQLWGLIACHNYSPKFIDYYDRHTCKFITEVFSSHLGLKANNQLLEKVNLSNKIRSKLIDQMSTDWNIHNGLSLGDYSLLDLTEADGAAISVNNEITILGTTPSKTQIKQLIDELYLQSNWEPLPITSARRHISFGKDIEKIASGILFMPISMEHKNALLWFKPEKISEIQWGGNPNKSVNEINGQLSPRTSFAKYTEEQRGQSEPWLDYEIGVAKALKEHIAEVIMQRYAEMKTISENLTTANKELESFSYSVSHDLRAPLRGIDGFAQILKEEYFDSLDDFGKQAVLTIINSTEKMNLLIDDILGFSGLGRGSIEKNTFSMNQLVKEVLDFNHTQKVYPKSTVTVHQLPDAYGDRAMIFQLVNNLVNNALKYSSKTDNPKIEIGFHNGSYHVKDNGIGLDEKYTAKIFGVFNRLVSDEYEGSGIGLALVQKVIDKHNGSITVKSQLGKGATFSFALPSKP